jgi:hypothetical protein
MSCATCPSPSRRTGVFCSFGAGGLVCLSCKVARDGAAFIKTPVGKYSWEKCNQTNLPLLVADLAHFYQFSRRNPLPRLVGADVATTHAAPLEKLLAFAEKEASDYGFTPLEFSLVRLERAVDLDTRNVWLTLCIAYDMGNFLQDLMTYCEKANSGKDENGLLAVSL